MHSNKTFDDQELLSVDFFCATLGSMGAASVPSSSIVLIMTSYQTTFGGNGEPPSIFCLIMAIEWLIDRFRTMTNICGDLTMAGCVCQHTRIRKYGNQSISL